MIGNYDYLTLLLVSSDNKNLTYAIPSENYLKLM